MNFKTILTGGALSFLLFGSSCLGAQNTGVTQTSSSLTVQEATHLALSTVEKGTSMGYVVTATIIDLEGNLLASVRHENAIPFTPKIAFKKAFTTLTAKEGTTELVKRFTKGDGLAEMNQFVVSNLNHSDNIIFLGGGLLIKKGGQIVGAIGVSGAPGGHLDDDIIREAFTELGYAE